MFTLIEVYRRTLFLLGGHYSFSEVGLLLKKPPPFYYTTSGENTCLKKEGVKQPARKAHTPLSLLIPIIDPKDVEGGTGMDALDFFFE